MNPAAIFSVSALLLSIERVTYVWAWRCPQRFEALCRDRLRMADPVRALRGLFRVFKLLQASVFVAWCWWWSNGSWTSTVPVALGAGAAMAIVGQALNVAVFHRLGHDGVFYGVRFGREVPWCREFPFSVLDHPQYVGTLLTIWGFFVATRYPHPDWLVLPLLETAFYWLGARYER